MKYLKRNLRYPKVIDIRGKNRNPDVAVGPNVHFGNLKNISYKQAVQLFDERIRDRYFNIAAQLAKRENHKSGDIFVIMMLDCIIIDFLSQYRYGLTTSNSNRFKDFINEYLRKYGRKLKHPIKSCSFYHGEWREVVIEDISDAIWHCFRCSLVHSGIIGEYGRINEINRTDGIELRPWKTDMTRFDIQVHPARLLNEIQNVFRRYILQLRQSSDKEYKRNFLTKFSFDFGIKIRT